MRIAIFSDIHANEANLLRGLQDMKEEAADEIWCLGDLVGYGEFSNNVLDIIREKCDFVLAGNHDFAISERFPGFIEGVPEWLSITLRDAVDNISEDNMKWIKTLEPKGMRLGLEGFHGSPDDPVSGYITEDNARLILASSSCDILLCGHSHTPFAFSIDKKNKKDFTSFYPDKQSSIALLENRKYVLNPGSMGLKQFKLAPVENKSSRWMLLNIGSYSDYSNISVSWHTV